MKSIDELSTAELKAYVQKEAIRLRMEANMRTLRETDALIDAGWRWEVPGGNANLDPWQWFWRRPPRRKGSKGMLFLSTTQALNHLLRSQGRKPEEFSYE